MAYKPKILALADGGTNANLTAAANNIVISGASALSLTQTLPTAVQGNITSTGNLGNQTNTTRCIFQAYLSATATNATGDGTTVNPIVFNSTNFNVGTSLNTSTGIFTAPVTGKYLFTAIIWASNLGAAHNEIQGGFSATSGLYATQISIIGSVTSQQSVTISSIISMTANDTCQAYVLVAGSTKTVGILANGATDPRTVFSGYLLS